MAPRAATSRVVVRVSIRLRSRWVRSYAKYAPVPKNHPLRPQVHPLAVTAIAVGSE